MTRREANRVTVTVNDGFTDELKRAFQGKFEGVEIQTSYALFAMALVTTRVDGEDLTQEQADFIATFEQGFGSAMMLLRKAVE